MKGWLWLILAYVLGAFTGAWVRGLPRKVGA